MASALVDRGYKWALPSGVCFSASAALVESTWPAPSRPPRSFQQAQKKQQRRAPPSDRMALSRAARPTLLCAALSLDQLIDRLIDILVIGVLRPKSKPHPITGASHLADDVAGHHPFRARLTSGACTYVAERTYTYGSYRSVRCSVPSRFSVPFLSYTQCVNPILFMSSIDRSSCLA